MSPDLAQYLDDIRAMEPEITCIVAQAVYDCLRPKVAAVAATWAWFDSLCETASSGRYRIVVSTNWNERKAS